MLTLWMMALALLGPAAGQPAATKPVFYTVRGSGGQAILWIHGLGLTASSWDGALTHLTGKGRYTHVRVDLPGHGRSAALRSVDFAELGKTLASILVDEQLSNVIVVGHSLGGAIAPWVAVAAPERVKLVVIVDQPGGVDAVTDAELEATKAALNKDKAAAVAALFGPSSQSPGQTALLVEAARQVETEVLLQYQVAARKRGAAEALKLKPVPAVLFASRLLLASPPEKTLSKAGYAGVANMRLAAFSHTSHWLHWDDPQGFVDALQDL